MKATYRISLSVVSHGQATLIRNLLDDLAKLSQRNFEVLLTINIPEDESLYQRYPFPINIIRNKASKGFGANHNAAFHHSRGRWFFVVNPDIRVNALDFDELLSTFGDENIGAVAPLVFSSNGEIEGSARRFPTVIRLAERIIFRRHAVDYEVNKLPYPVDWVAGMFVVFRREAYQSIGGFDDRRFYMYFEDVDICYRLARQEWKVFVNPNVKVIHSAQRASHRNLKHMQWHITSAFRFLTGI